MERAMNDPKCTICHGSGVVVDYVDYGSTIVPMDSYCECYSPFVVIPVTNGMVDELALYADNKLNELYDYLSPLIKKGWNKANLAKNLLKIAEQSLSTGSSIYAPEIGSIDSEAYGQLVFVRPIVNVSGNMIQWYDLDYTRLFEQLEETGG
jgi:hypothetical protein